MTRRLAVFVGLTALGLSMPARAQAPTQPVAPAGAQATQGTQGTPGASLPSPALTKTVLPEVPTDSKANNDTFVLEPQMSIDLDDPPAGPAGFDENTAYVPLSSGRVVAIDLDQATLRWSHDINTTMAPVVNGGLVVVFGDDQLTAFDAASGKPQWSVPITGGLSAPPLVDSGWVVAAANGGDVMTLRAADGKPIWTRSLGTAIVAQPFIAADAVYFSLADGRILKLALLTGEPQWEHALPGRPGEMLVLDDRLFVGCADKRLYCLNTKNGKERWHWRTGGKPVGPPAVDEKRVYYAPLDNILWALDRNNGVMKWRAELPVRPSSGPIVIGRIVAVAAVALEIYGYRVDTGVAAGKATLPSTDLAGPPQVLPNAHPLVAAVGALSREGTFTLLRRQLEPLPLPMPYPFGDEIPLRVIGAELPAAP